MYYDIFNEVIHSLEKGNIEEFMLLSQRRHVYTSSIRQFAFTMHGEYLTQIARAIAGYRKEHKISLYESPPWEVLSEYRDRWLLKQIRNYTKTSVNMFIDEVVLPEAKPPARLPEEYYNIMSAFIEAMYSRLYKYIYSLAIEIMPNYIESIFLDALDPPREDPVEEMSRFSPAEYRAIKDCMLRGKPYIGRTGISVFPFNSFCNTLRETTLAHILNPSKRQNRWSSFLDKAYRRAFITYPNWPYRILNNDILLSNIHDNELTGLDFLDITDIKAINMIETLLWDIYRSTFIQGKPVGMIDLDKVRNAAYGLIAGAQSQKFVQWCIDLQKRLAHTPLILRGSEKREKEKWTKSLYPEPMTEANVPIIVNYMKETHYKENPPYKHAIIIYSYLDRTYAESSMLPYLIKLTDEELGKYRLPTPIKVHTYECPYNTYKVTPTFEIIQSVVWDKLVELISKERGMTRPVFHNVKFIEPPTYSDISVLMLWPEYDGDIEKYIYSVGYARTFDAVRTLITSRFRTASTSLF